MIDTLIRRGIAKLWRWRIARRESQREWTGEFMAWKRAHPDRCMYCSYTSWANREHGQKLALEPHACVEGKSPAAPLPRAKVVP